MTRKKANLSADQDTKSRKREHQEDLSVNENIVEFVNSTKKKRKNKGIENACTDEELKTDDSLPEKKVRFNVEEEELPCRSSNDDGQEAPKDKKKVRKPRWSEERKDDERKRRSEEGSTNQAEAHQPKKKKKSKKKFKPAIVDATSGMSTSALQYLQHWQYDRGSWKFSKGKQTWLLKHAFDLKKVPKSMFPILVEYISTCKGGARTKTYEAAVKIIKRLEEKASTEEVENSEEKEILECLEGGDSEEDKKEIHQRARSIMQQL
ncbi:cholesin [Hetaerina americana]|uniref:cholesin n=1 Tax=Hetaerina americana TaxID=62018 RepID=UPI003A7F393C